MTKVMSDLGGWSRAEGFAAHNRECAVSTAGYFNKTTIFSGKYPRHGHCATHVLKTSDYLRSRLDAEGLIVQMRICNNEILRVAKELTDHE
jgi:hypothetical protein